MFIACDLLDSNRLGQVAREVDVQALSNSEPVCDQLQRNDVQETLQAVDSLWHLNSLGLGWWEFGIVLIADDNGSSFTGNDCRHVST
jgi:hypothetical protein